MKSLPPAVQRDIAVHEATLAKDPAGYAKAIKPFYDAFVLRHGTPAYLKAYRAALPVPFAAAQYNSMWGPSEIKATGTLRDYDGEPLLKQIAAPDPRPVRRVRRVVAGRLQAGRRQDQGRGHRCDPGLRALDRGRRHGSLSEERRRVHRRARLGVALPPGRIFGKSALPCPESSTMPDLYDVAAIGNAIVDVIAPADDAFLDAERPRQGRDDAGRPGRSRRRSTRKMAAGVEASGGSAANTIAGVASFGGKGAFMGKVADDQLGEVFAHDMRAIGARFETAPLVGGPATARLP